MKYENVREGIFLSRPNRFVAHVEIDGREEICHVKNTGRCKELLIPGVNVFLEYLPNHNRKTKYDLICVEKDGQYINIDSQAPNKIFSEWLSKSKYFGENSKVKSEKTYKNSRFDFYIESGERKIFVEVKGVTLKIGDTALFPDAPTERGVKHINELVLSLDEGYEAYIFFIIQMKGVKSLSPNISTDPEFGKALSKANKRGVKIVAIDCVAWDDEINADEFVEVVLSPNV